MRFEVIREVDAECIHFWEPSTGTMISSKGNTVRVETPSRTYRFVLPVSIPRRPLLTHRMSRRLCRLDKMNALFSTERDRVIAIYLGQLLSCDLGTGEVSRKGALRQSRNALHCGICVANNGSIYLGEYGHNGERAAVPVWRSDNNGESWEIVYEFPPGQIKHIHGIYQDPFSGRLFIPTGDFEGECFLFEADTDFADIKKHGTGGQAWRPVSLMFEDDHIVWGMDTPLVTARLQVFSRADYQLTPGQTFPGPVWYSKSLSDGVSLLQSSCEPGDGVTTDRAHLFASVDRRNWSEIRSWKKDKWPMNLFKYGVVAFADGNQPSNNFAIFGEALAGFDGKAYLAAIS